MTNKTIVLLVLFVILTWSGAAGIAVAVTQTVEGPQGEQGSRGPAGPSGASAQADSTICHNALQDYIEITLEVLLISAQGVASIPPSLQEKIDEAGDDFTRYC